MPTDRRDGILWRLRQRERYDDARVGHATFCARGVELAVVEPVSAAEHHCHGRGWWSVEKSHAPLPGAQAVGPDDIVVLFSEAVGLDARLVIAAVQPFCR